MLKHGDDKGNTLIQTIGGVNIPTYKDKAKNTWYFRIYITESNGRRKQKYQGGFLTKTEAKNAEINFVSNYKNIENNKITFNQLYDEYIRYKHQTLKQKSYNTIKNRIENHILPYFKDYYIQNITTKDYINFKEDFLSKEYSYKYCSSIHVAFVNILNYAIKFDYIKENIASKVGNFSNKNYINKFDFWTIEEFKQFINNVDDIIYYTFFYILFNTGMRLGECISLTWEDLKEDYITINKTYIGTDNGMPIFNTPKTKGSYRTIKIDNNSIIYLNRLKEFYSNTIGFNSKWYIFGGIRPLAPTTIERKKNNYCKIANVKQIKIHEFRHSHATFLISNGIPITLISKRLGHSSISMTLDTYSHFIPQDEEKAINLINNLYKNINI